MTRSTAIVFIALLAINSSFASPIELKKSGDSGVCQVCKALVDGGKTVGADALGLYLDVSIGSLCYTIMLPSHKKCIEQLEKVKEELKDDIQNGVPTETACHNALLC